MIPVPRQVYDGGFEWYGLSVSIEGSHFLISQGRIGTYTNPIRRCSGSIDGGWYLPPTEINLHQEISRIDVVSRDHKAFLMFRSPDARERYPDEFVLLLSLAWREGDEWYVSVPQRKKQT